MSRYVAAVHHARYYESLPAEELAAHIFPIWADGVAAPYIAKTFAARGAEALRAAERALAEKAGRAAKRTAVRVLQAVAQHGGPAGAEAEVMLGNVARHAKDAGLRASARDALLAVSVARPDGEGARERRAAAFDKAQALATALQTAPTQEERREALKALVELGELSALPALRRAFCLDASRTVREEAAYALGQLGDAEMVETFVGRLASRGEDEREAKIAAYALGYLGDARGLDELLSAYADGYKPAIVADAIRAFGPVALSPLLDLIEARPEVAKRAAALDVLKKMDDTVVAEGLLGRVEAARGGEGFAGKALLYVKLAEVHPHAKREVASAVLSALGGAEGDEAQAALKAARRALGVVKRG
jgi:HEAT repeat protein